MAEWGDTAEGEDLEPEGSESGPATIDLGNGLVLRIDDRAFRRMMHSPEIQADVDRRGRELADRANAESITKGAIYEYVPSTNPDNKRARGRVMTANYKAQVDDAHHSTLLKALASVGSDPKPEGAGHESDEAEAGGHTRARAGGDGETHS